MASRQLGRLRQWAGEVISTREKAPVDDEFLELEKDVQLRREGMQKLTTASEAYHHALSKTKTSDVLTDEEKLLPIDSLGLVMIGHGEEFRDESVFGRALVKLGRAHCKVATLQEAYALTFKDTFIASMDRFKEQFKEYESLKKKLENRRTIYDSVATKFEKVQNSGKKEKDRREAEDELERARQRYEETAEDMRAHTRAIQENEHDQLKDLIDFLNLELKFVQSYLDVLKDVKADWSSDPKRSTRTNGDNDVLGFRPSSRSSFKHKNGKDRMDSATPTAESSEDEDTKTRRLSVSSMRSRRGSTSSRPPSRPSSRLSRKRKDSVSASPDEKERGKDGPEKTRKMSVSGWATSAVESVTGGGRGTGKKSKDTDLFTALDEPSTGVLGDDANGHKVRKSSSFRGLARSSKNKSKENLSTSQGPPKILAPPSMQGKKVVRAMYDFSGSSDELSFKTGNEIVVVNEVLDDWWMGELNGQRGLFPASYTQPLGSSNASVNRTPKINALHLQPETLHAYDSDHDHYLMSDLDDEHIIGATPMAANKSPVFYGAFNDQASITDSAAESTAEDNDDDFNATHPPPPVPARRPLPDFDFDDNWGTKSTTATPSKKNGNQDSAKQPLINRSHSDETYNAFVSAASTVNGNATPVKKMPPPPPPRRFASATPTPTPPIPERRLPGHQSTPSIISRSSHNSTTSLSISGNTSGSGAAYDRSPFDSAVELNDIKGVGDVCQNFRQNPFKQKGMCSNCLQFHQ